MIRYIKLKEHKGIVALYLKDLGHINIFCGRNNSGKTSILEALILDGKHAVGKKVEDLDWLCTLFQSEAKRYTTPSPVVSNNWFRSYMENVIRKEEVWYEDETAKIAYNMVESHKNYPGLSGYGDKLFDFDVLFESFFKKTVEWYRPVLIPPKRVLQARTNINLNEQRGPDGAGMVNLLFYLKNQDLESPEYRTFEKIYETFRRLTDYRFNIIPDKENQLTLEFTKDGSKWFSADVCGLGLSDILVMISVILAYDSTFICIEEPESHVHAQYQRRLLQFLTEVKSKQFVLTTHSGVFLDSSYTDKIFYTTCEQEVVISDETSRSSIIRALGHSVADNLVADALVLTEGPKDVPVISEILRWLQIEERYNIKYWHLGGDVMSELDLSVLAERNLVFAIVDLDPGSSVQRTRFLRNCKKYQITCCKLKRYSIENYFTIDAIRKVFPNQIPQALKELDPLKPVDEQIGFKKKNKSIKSKNRMIIQNMSLDDLKNTDLLEFLSDIKKKIATSTSYA
jgi:predicted ATPase